MQLFIDFIKINYSYSFFIIYLEMIIINLYSRKISIDILEIIIKKHRSKYPCAKKHKLRKKTGGSNSHP